MVQGDYDMYLTFPTYPATVTNRIVGAIVELSVGGVTVFSTTVVSNSASNDWAVPSPYY